MTQDNKTRVTHDGLPVHGYKSQSEQNVALVNNMKLMEENILRSLDTLQGTADPRWLAIGRTALEQGFMAVNRSIFKPSRAKLPGDPPDAPPPQFNETNRPNAPAERKLGE